MLVLHLNIPAVLFRSEAVVCYRRAGHRYDRGPHPLLRSLMPVTADLLTTFTDSRLIGRTGWMDGRTDRNRKKDVSPPPPPPLPSHSFPPTEEKLVTCREKLGDQSSFPLLLMNLFFLFFNFSGGA